jgi:hypothetical protein
MKILAIDLGKFNSVACLFDTTTNHSEFETFATQRWAFEQLLAKTQPVLLADGFTIFAVGWVTRFWSPIPALRRGGGKTSNAKSLDLGCGN